MTQQTVVVGAGLAGLSAAYELVRAGHPVQVFEANQRVGGRTYTVQLSASQYGELGADFVDDHHTALKTYAAELGLILDPALGENDLYWWVGGKLCNWNTLTDNQRAALEQLNTELSALLEQQADPPQTLKEWLVTHPIAPFARQMAYRDTRSLFTADAESIGVGFFAHLSETDSVNTRIQGGSSRLAEALAKRLGDRVHTGTPVRRIQQQNGSVSLTLETAEGQSEITAETVVLAIPWSVLRHLSIDVPLTESQRQGIATLPYGHAVKTLLQYPNRFWPRSNFGLVLIEGQYQAIWEPTFAQAGAESILACLSGGTPSLQLGEQVYDLAKQAVEDLHPDTPKPIASACYNWNTNEWSRGAYCYFGPGDLHRFNPHLTQPAGRVFFAGEHTAPEQYRGYMEGAIRSGQRAAQQILANAPLGD